MCGLFFSSSKHKEKLFNQFELVKDLLSHRGPDGEKSIFTEFNGYHSVFNHNRLSIIGDELNGIQPCLRNGNILLFNGEIYNYKDLANKYLKDLKTKIFNSDTEVLSDLFSKYEFEFICKQLQGMYSIIYWDNKLHRIFATRDLFGTKPLYYVNKNGLFSLSSEIGPLIKCDNRIALSKEKIYSFFLWGLNKSPDTFYQDIYSLVPGELIVFKINGEIERRDKIINFSKQNLESSLNFNELFERAVTKSYVADVEVGLMLSGGLDSTAIALASKNLGYSPKCYNMSYNFDNSSSENIIAEKIANKCNFEFYNISFTNDDIENEFDNYFSHIDHPSDDGFNIFLISKNIRKLGIKTCLSGLGGDELFGGYRAKKILPLLSQFSKFIKFNHFFKLFNIFGYKKFNKFLELISHNNPEKQYLVLRQLIDNHSLKKILNYETDNFNISFQVDKESYFANAVKYEFEFYAGEKLLKDGDFQSMRNSLEFRYPLLDRDLVNYVIKNYKCEFLSKNKIEVYNKIIKNYPFDILNLPKKGFTVPVQSILKKNILKNKRDIISFSVDQIGMNEKYLNLIMNFFIKKNYYFSFMWNIYLIYNLNSRINFKFI